MKQKNILFGIAALVLASMVVLAGCGGGGDNALAGRWGSTGGAETLELFKNGIAVAGKDNAAKGQAVNWATQDSRLLWWTALVEGSVYDYKVSGSTLTLTTGDGDTKTFIKMKKVTGPLTEAEAESFNTQAGLGAVEKGWKFEQGESYADLSVKKGKVTAPRVVTRGGNVYVSLEADDQGNTKAARYVRQNGDVFEPWESAQGNQKAARFTAKDGTVYESWEQDAAGNAKAAKITFTSGEVWEQWEKDAQDNVKAAKITGRDGTVYEQFEEDAQGNRKAAGYTGKDGTVYEQWERGAWSSATYLKDGKRVRL